MTLRQTQRIVKMALINQLDVQRFASTNQIMWVHYDFLSFSHKFVTICFWRFCFYKNHLKMYETVITLVTEWKEFLWFLIWFINSKMPFYFIFIGNFSSYRGCSSRGSQSFLHCFGSYHRIESTRKASSECWFGCY